MSKLIVGFILGIAVSTVGAGEIAKWVDYNVSLLKDYIVKVNESI